jgi:hypothetical protein
MTAIFISPIGGPSEALLQRVIPQLGGPYTKDGTGAEGHHAHFLCLVRATA